MKNTVPDVPDVPDWLPKGLPDAPKDAPMLCQGAFLSPEQGQAVLEAALARFPDLKSWNSYADHLRDCIQNGLNLSPYPRRTPLNSWFGPRRDYHGYSVENIAFESVPGRKIETEADFDHHGRFEPSVQACGAALARLGVVALSIDMLGNGDSIAQFGQEAHGKPFAMTIQSWNAMRALDFLLELEGADPTRVAVTGASGGATQALILTALDARVTLSVPVVMVSAHFFGGCACESGLPVHRSETHFASNAIIATLAAPRPTLLVSDGHDWTLGTPAVEFPFLQRIYQYFGAISNAKNVHLPAEGHDYGPSKRAAMLEFVARHFELSSHSAATLEADISIEKALLMRVWHDQFLLPAHACESVEAVELALRQL